MDIQDYMTHFIIYAFPFKLSFGLPLTCAYYLLCGTKEILGN